MAKDDSASTDVENTTSTGELVPVRILVDSELNGRRVKCNQVVLASADQAENIAANGIGDTSPAAVEYAISQLADGENPLDISRPAE